ncbi:MAG TPA: phosphoadenylyl-sulfate reductase [Ferruginibacter sp.]|nr:phosphoadenylyl-sulfate reductase [Ferruginibacter sp.]HRE64451.1 phosphoadenylyl-sulfate reductase [Ferruginibacter sp.]
MQKPGTELLNDLIHKISGLSTIDALKYLSARFAGEVTFSSSLSYEDQVITHDILQNNIAIEIFTLDTGRLFAETYAVWNSTNERYHTHIKAYYPQHSPLEKFVEDNGPNAFYQSVELRKQCCYIRKVEPLQRALQGKSVWVTGLRAQHSDARNHLPKLEWDEVNQIIKFHPLLHWSSEEVKEYVSANNIPYNPLHDKGFVSIGCAPCTRAIKPGEDFRAGRWWWEDANKKECGLHSTS